jgi:zinc transport system ATP-binding protein
MADAPVPLVEARGLGVAYGGRTVLERVDLAVAPGEIVTVVGPNGSGKTTLVRAVLGLIDPSAGAVRRREPLSVGYVPQHLAIDPTLPLTVRRFLRLGARAGDDAIDAVLKEVGAGALAGAACHALSGGELRRVALARALLRSPDLLVLDEPTSGVDVSGQAALYRLIRRIRDARGCGVLLVSHSLHLVMAATDRVICLNRHICCEGHPEAVSRHPEYLALFGDEAAGDIAVYAHHHDHAHDLSGAPVDGDAHGHGEKPPAGSGDGKDKARSHG